MGFEIVEGPVRELWAGTNGAATYYTGQLQVWSNEGVYPVAAASGAGDTSGKQIIAGVALGANVRTPTFDATYLANVATGVVSQANQLARDVAFNGGNYPIGDPQLLIKLGMIDSSTILRAPICNAAVGTAPTVVTATVGSTDGLGFTSGACDFTPVADYATTYCRSGANKGLFRVSDDTSTTVETNDVGFPYDIAIGDTFVRVPLKLGLARLQVGAIGLYVAAEATPGTDYFSVIITKLNLAEAGKETVEFKFLPLHFDPLRA